MSLLIAAFIVLFLYGRGLLFNNPEIPHNLVCGFRNREGVIVSCQNLFNVNALTFVNNGNQNAFFFLCVTAVADYSG